MKVKPKQYAQYLLESLSSATKDEAILAIEKFVRFLMDNGDAGKISMIFSEFSALWDKQNNIAEAEVQSARPLSRNIIEAVEEWAKNESGAKKIVLKEKINQDLLGGVLLRVGSKEFDATLKLKLAQLKEKISS